MLSLDLPPIPLFQDELESNIIPQISLSTLFHQKYNRNMCFEDTGMLKRYTLTRHPRYMILYFRRFKRVKGGAIEFNPTVVNFGSTMEFGGAVDGQSRKYRLTANICVVDGLAGPTTASYKVYLLNKSDEQKAWKEVMDLYVGEAAWEMISLQTSYIQFWERCDLALSY